MEYTSKFIVWIEILFRSCTYFYFELLLNETQIKQFRESFNFPLSTGKSKEDIRMQPYIVCTESDYVLFELPL